MAEHRAVQHRAVLEAAEKLIIANHGAVPSLADIASEVGLARSSIYRYVASQHDLMVQLLVQATKSWNEQLKVEVAAAPPESGPRIRAYVDAMLGLFTQGSHGPLMTAAQHFPQAFADEEVQTAHAGFQQVVDKFCPGVSAVDISLLNAAIMRAAERPAALEHSTTTLHKMATAIVAG